MCIFSIGAASKLNVHQVGQPKEPTPFKTEQLGRRERKITVVAIMPTANRLLLRQETHRHNVTGHSVFYSTISLGEKKKQPTKQKKTEKSNQNQNQVPIRQPQVRGANRQTPEDEKVVKQQQCPSAYSFLILLVPASLPSRGNRDRRFRLLLQALLQSSENSFDKLQL